jgi:hypothetical protein
MLLAAAVTQTLSQDLSAYPRWALILAGTLVAVVALWIVTKLLKWSLWLVLILVFLGGVGWAVWELMQSTGSP